MSRARAGEQKITTRSKYRARQSHHKPHKSCYTKDSSTTYIYANTPSTHLPRPLLPTPPLTSESSRPWVHIARRNGIVDVDQNPGVTRLVRPRERNQITRRLGPAPSDLELRTAKVKLRAARGLRHMQADVLVAHEVLTRGDAGWDGDVVGSGACRRQSRYGTLNREHRWTYSTTSSSIQTWAAPHRSGTTPRPSDPRYLHPGRPGSSRGTTGRDPGGTRWG